MLACYPSEHLIYETLIWKLYWLYMESEIYKFLSNFMNCPHIGTRLHHARKYELFPSTSRLEMVSVDILDNLLLPRMLPNVLSSWQTGVPN